MKRFLLFTFLSLFTLITLMYSPETIALPTPKDPEEQKKIDFGPMNGAELLMHGRDGGPADWAKRNIVEGPQTMRLHVTFMNTDGVLVHEDIVDGLEKDEIIFGGTAAATVDKITPTIWGVDINMTPTRSGTLTFYIEADAVTTRDTQRTNAQTPTWSLPIDLDPPTVSVTVPSRPQRGTFAVTVTFNEAVTGFEADDIIFSGTASRGTTATVSPDENDASTYTAHISPGRAGQLTYHIRADAAEDQVKHLSTASDPQTVTIDMDRPYVVKFSDMPDPKKYWPEPGTYITAIAHNPKNTLEYKVHYNEDVTLRESFVEDGTGFEYSFSGSGKVHTVSVDFHGNRADIGGMQIWVGEHWATDAAGNSSLVKIYEHTVHFDTERPKVFVGDWPEDDEVVGEYVLYVGGSDDWTNFSVAEYHKELIVFKADDIILGGTATASITDVHGDFGNYFTVTPTTDGTVTFQVKADVIYDWAGNSNLASEVYTCNVDVTPPTVELTVPETPQPDTFDITVTFSEPVNDFTADDVTVNGPATATALSANAGNSVYTVTITPDAGIYEEDVTFQIAAGVVTDKVGLSNTASTEHTVGIDTLVPTARISNVPSTPQNGAFDVTIWFDEHVTGFVVADDLAITGGTATASLKSTVTSNWKYEVKVTITPDTGQEADITLQVKADAVTDAAGNTNAASTGATVPIDTLGPTVLSFTGLPTTAQRAPFDITVTFSEAVNGFATDDVVVTGGATATAVSGSDGDTAWTVSITPNANTEADITVQVKADAVTDAAGNSNTAASDVSTVSIDTLPPKIVANEGVPDAEAVSAPFDLTVTFSEPVNGFTAEDVEALGPATVSLKSGSDGDLVYVLLITPTPNSDERAMLHVPANAVQDAAGNHNPDLKRIAVVFTDTLPPKIVANEGVPDAEAVSAPFDLTVTFSEPVNGFTAEDVEALGPATVSLKSGSDGDLVYVLLITPTPNSDERAMLHVPANAVQDAAGNHNPDLKRIAVVFIDTVAPEIESIEVEEVENVPLYITFAFSERVNGLAADDLIVTGPATMRVVPGTVAQVEPGEYWDSIYLAYITPDATSEGEVTVQVRADAVQDAAGNTNAASAVTSVGRVDTLAPTVTITEVPTATQLAAFSVNIEFSEDVIGFELTDITLSGDAVVGNTVLTAESGKAYTLTITPHEDTDGDVTITVPADVVQDVVQQNNAASAPQTVSVAPAWIPDANLRAAIRVALGLAAGADFSRAQLAALKTLAVPLAVTDLTGLEHAINLTSIDVKNSQITSLKALARATKLTALDLSDNDITDITSLQHLTGLIKLDLRGNNITDIAPLDNLTNLTTLLLSDNDITDITSLQYLTNLTTLILGDNDITDITPLEDLANLTILGINSNPISSLDPVKVLTSLTTLELSGNALSDLSPLSGLTGLQRLYLTDNAITSSDLNAITGLTALIDLDLSKNKVTGLTALANFTQLKELSLNDNNITDVNPLAALTVLENLYLADNAIVDIEPLTGLANLKVLWLEGNPIVNTAPLYPLTQRVPPVDIDITVEAGIAEEDFDGAPDIDIPGAPSAMDIFTHLDRATLEALDPASLKATLDRLRLESDGSQKYLHAIKLLQNVLAQLLPEKTRLLANYPNPFNPETWIPYQLAKGSDVEIFIYDMRGTLVRHLALGHQHAGYYTEKSRAAYWDGRNTVGERVASGIYFYRLQAENTSLLRKMLILK